MLTTPTKMAPKKKKSSRYNWVSLQREEGLLCVPSWRDLTAPLETSGYILNKVLYAHLTRADDHVGTDSYIPQVSEMIYIHPDTMKLCSIMINQPVVVMETTNKVITISKVWPSKSLDLHRVALNKNLSSRLQCTDSSLVCIEALPLSYTVPIIKEIQLTQISKDKIVFSDTFKHYIVFKQEGTVLSQDSIISLPFHGQDHTFTVNLLTITQTHRTTTNVCSNTSVTEECKDESYRITKDREGGEILNTTDTSNLSLTEPLSSLSLFSSTPLKKDDIKTSPYLSSPSITNSVQHTLPVLYDDSVTVDETPPTNATPTSATPTMTTHINDTPTSTLPASATPIPFTFLPSQQLNKLVFGKVTLSTKVKLTKEELLFDNKITSLPVLTDIGGYKEIIRTLKELVLYPFLYPLLINKEGVVFPKGLLLHGPSGTGKSLLASALARTANVHYNIINYTDILINGESYLSQILAQARGEAPSIIIINDIHRVCPQKEEGLSSNHNLSALVKHFDEVAKQPTPHMVVMATTNDLSSVNIDLRHPGKLETEVEVPAPVANEREEILKLLLKGHHHCMSEREIKEIAVTAHGHVGADLKAICLKAQQLLLRTHFDDTLSMVPIEEREDMVIDYTVMRKALQLVQPTAMREITVEVPRVLWSDIGGEEEIKKELREATEWPINHPQALQRMGLDPPRGILLYGPPGCSKTMIVRALATESGFNFLSIKGPEIFTKWVGDSERAIRQVFSRARSAAPSIIFFDEIDSIATHRQGNEGGSKVGDRVLTQLLTEIDGVELLKGVLIVAATNRPDIIDKALLRSGRIDKKIYVPLPCTDTRRGIFEISFKRTPIDEGVNIEELVKRTHSYSGAEVVAVVQRAGQLALSEDINTQYVSWRHFELALNDIKPSTDLCTLKLYEDFQKTTK